MQSSIDSFIATLAGLLGPLSPFAKAVVPAAAGLVTAVVNMPLVGSFNTTSIVTLGLGVVTAAAVYLIPNLTRKPTPTPSPAKPSGK